METNSQSMSFTNFPEAFEEAMKRRSWLRLLLGVPFLSIRTFFNLLDNFSLWLFNKILGIEIVERKVEEKVIVKK